MSGKNVKKMIKLIDILKESKGLHIVCTLIDKSGQCEEMVEKINKVIN